MKRWFYNGTFMPDGTPITVGAECDVQAAEYLSRGYRPVAEPAKKKRTRTTRPPAKRPGKDKRGDR